jgi:hypothetical protein
MLWPTSYAVRSVEGKAFMALMLAKKPALCRNSFVCNKKQVQEKTD